MAKLRNLTKIPRPLTESVNEDMMEAVMWIPSGRNIQQR